MRCFATGLFLGPRYRDIHAQGIHLLDRQPEVQRIADIQLLQVTFELRLAVAGHRGEIDADIPQATPIFFQIVQILRTERAMSAAINHDHLPVTASGRFADARVRAVQ